MLADSCGKKRNGFVPDYVVFDLETTGISSAYDEVIEISAIRVQGGTVTGEYSTLVNPGRRIPAAASRVNGIYDDMVKDSPDFETALAEFLKFAGDAVLVGHNIHSFDMKFLNRDAMKYWGKAVGNDYIDTLTLARQCLPEQRHHRLVDLAAYYGISQEGAHRALNDCRMNQQVYELLGQESRKVCGKESNTCPKCGDLLARRKGKYGEFWGCTGYPNCRYTKNIATDGLPWN